jgi:hypothetical protein
MTEEEIEQAEADLRELIKQSIHIARDVNDNVGEPSWELILKVVPLIQKQIEINRSEK